MKTSSAKAKGRRLQQLVAKKISELTGIPYGKDAPIESRPMGQSGTDVRLTGRAKKKFKFDVECKNMKAIAIYKWIEQAQTNTSKGRDWLVVCKANNTKPVAIVDLDVFFKLLEKGR